AAHAQDVAGRIMAPAGRQLAWLDMDAPRPQLLTHFDAPAYVMDVAASPSAAVAVISVSRPLQDGNAVGGDLLTIDLLSSQLAPLVLRSDAAESLGAPAWSFDGSSVLFERQDHSRPGLAYAGDLTVVYPVRLDNVQR